MLSILGCAVQKTRAFSGPREECQRDHFRSAARRMTPSVTVRLKTVVLSRVSPFPLVDENEVVTDSQRQGEGFAFA